MFSPKPANHAGFLLTKVIKSIIFKEEKANAFLQKEKGGRVMPDKTRTLEDIEQEIEALSALPSDKLNLALHTLCVELLTPEDPIIRMAQDGVSKRIRGKKGWEWRYEATKICGYSQCLVLGNITYYGGILVYIDDILYVMNTAWDPDLEHPHEILCFTSKDRLSIKEIKERLPLFQGIFSEAALKKFFPVPVKT